MARSIPNVDPQCGSCSGYCAASGGVLPSDCARGPGASGGAARLGTGTSPGIEPKREPHGWDAPLQRPLRSPRCALPAASAERALSLGGLAGRWGTPAAAAA
eukprot:574043-Prymnesium_polylepis.1